MSKKPLLSIITVNLNDVEGLSKTMNSVFEQTFKDFEYIVIDGDSKDGSKEYVIKNKNKLDYWLSEKDSGIYNAMNKGIKAATGKYLLFLNSGDWLFNKNILQKVSLKLFDCDLLYGNIVKSQKGKKDVLDKGPAGNKITLSTFLNGSLHHQASFLNKNLFEKYGCYDEGLKIVSDWKFSLIAFGLNNSIIKYIDTEISFYDLGGISMNFQVRDSEREIVINEIIPSPIYSDYQEKTDLQSINSSEVKTSSIRIFKIGKFKTKLKLVVSIIGSKFFSK